MKGKTPTRDEQEWMDAVRSIGCIVCRNAGHYHVPAAIHHMLSGGLRMGHAYVLPLCEPGHHQQSTDNRISRHPWWRRFEKAYGTEQELDAQVMEILARRSDRLAALPGILRGDVRPSGGVAPRPVFKR